MSRNCWFITIWNDKRDIDLESLTVVQQETPPKGTYPSGTGNRSNRYIEINNRYYTFFWHLKRGHQENGSAPAQTGQPDTRNHLGGVVTGLPTSGLEWPTDGEVAFQRNGHQGPDGDWHRNSWNFEDMLLCVILAQPLILYRYRPN